MKFTGLSLALALALPAWGQAAPADPPSAEPPASEAPASEAPASGAAGESTDAAASPSASPVDPSDTAASPKEAEPGTGEAGTGAPDPNAEVEAPPPHVSIDLATTSPAWIVRIGDAPQPTGTSTPFELSLPAGTHAVELSVPGKPAPEGTQTSSADTVITVWVTVRSAEPAEGTTPVPAEQPGRRGQLLVDVALGQVLLAEGPFWAAIPSAAIPSGNPQTRAGAVGDGSGPSTQPAGGQAASEPEGREGSSTDCPGKRPCIRSGSLSVWPRTRIRAGLELQQPDGQVLFIGQNDGFRLEQARFGFGGQWRDLMNFRLTFDGAALLPGRAKNVPVSPFVASVIDAYVHVAPIPWIGVWVGQTFMPADFEGSVSRGRTIFTDRSIASGGVRAGRGFEVFGLSPGREVGLVVGAKDAPIGPVRLDYRLAISNGNGAAVFGNDNKLPALHARLGGGWERYVAVGIGGAYNPRTTGTLPNLYNETDLQAYADLKVDAFGFDFLAQAIVRQTTFDSVFPDVTDPNRSALGYGATAWLVIDEPFGLPMFGFRPGARVSFYDPTTSFTDDQLAEATVGFRYDPKAYDLPVALIVDLTALVEVDAATGIQALDNNRIVGLIQFDL